MEKEMFGFIIKSKYATETYFFFLVVGNWLSFSTAKDKSESFTKFFIFLFFKLKQAELMEVVVTLPPTNSKLSIQKGLEGEEKENEHSLTIFFILSILESRRKEHLFAFAGILSPK